MEERILTPRNCAFAVTATGWLRLTVNDEFSCRSVILRRLFPLQHPAEYISVCDGGGKEVGIIERLVDFSEAVRQLLQAELDYGYGTPVITAIESIRGEAGFYRWRTVTDRGSREFYVQGRTEHVRWFGAARVLVTDSENCRYEIPDVAALPAASRRALETVL